MKLNYINHIALVLDSSSSMAGLRQEMIRVVDEQITYLAKRSTELGQETRITVYTFADNVQCVVYDMDVLRLPSIGEFYTCQGWTALVDATLKSQQDLEKSATLYGDHAFLTYVFTDGQENRSHNRPAVLAEKLSGQPENWTVAVFVPDRVGVNNARLYGFPEGNIAVWEATSAAGLAEAGEKVRTTTDAYMTARATGTFKGSKAIFDMSTATVNHKTVKTLREVTSAIAIPVKMAGMDIRTFIEQRGETFHQGHYYFPFVKREKVGPQKNVLVRHKMSGKIFGGPEVRIMLGLPDHEISLSPGQNAEYDVFIQSTSTNRKLIQGHDLLVLP